MQIVIVRSCRTSAGEIVCEVPGGTRDVPLELPEFEARELIVQGHARLPPPDPVLNPAVLNPPADPPAVPDLEEQES